MDDLASQLDALDEDQSAAARQLRGPVAIIAGPGSGKTAVVSHRIAHGIALGVYEPSKVLALTYTNRAAAELRMRLRSLGAPGVQVRTFHAAALSQLQFFWPQLSSAPAPRLTTQKYQLLQEAAESIGLKLTKNAIFEILAKIEWHRYSLIEPSLVSALDLERVIAPQPFLDLFASYEAIKQQKKLVDWEDVLLLCIGMLRSEPRMLEHFHQQYRFFTVDEYQDISPLQQALLQTWLGERQDICVVGDPRQTIYSFAGASSKFLLNFDDHYANAQVFELDRNYRSAIEIVEYANKIMRSDLEAVRQYSSAPRFTAYKNQAAEAKGVASRIGELISAGLEPQDIAVLSRANFQLEQLETELAKLSIPTQLRGSGKFFQRPEVAQAMVAIRALAVAATERPLFADVSDILSSLGWRTSGSGEKWENLNWFIEVMEELGPEVTPAEYSRELAERERSGHEPAKRAVSLATIHATKGLQWRAVFVIGLNQGLFPSSYSQSPEQLAEERRLYFVAVTRAQDNLEISYQEDKPVSELLTL
jgi:DNA helicase II / ATP-dependent DNA helicase PcrA